MTSIQGLVFSGFWPELLLPSSPPSPPEGGVEFGSVVLGFSVLLGQRNKEPENGSVSLQEMSSETPQSESLTTTAGKSQNFVKSVQGSQRHKSCEPSIHPSIHPSLPPSLRSTPICIHPAGTEQGRAPPATSFRLACRLCLLLLIKAG